VSWQTARLSFAENHPAAPGHFPGNPMIPGALLLDAVIAAVVGAQCDAALVVRSAKFLRIVRPGDALDLRWRNLADGGVTFECLAAEAPVLTGVLMLKAGA
jgi:3-hydroxymyristoyl/3-hydroxydecanoyl-(acyl carrier protein) dehydratase